MTLISSICSSARTLFNPRALSGTGFLSVILSLFVMSATVGSLWVFEKINQRETAIEAIRENYIKSSKGMLQNEVRQVLDHITFKRNMARRTLENHIRENVRTAYTLASHIYSMNRDVKTVAQIAGQIRETLRPIRWDNGLGYYYILAGDGTMVLNADHPEYEGRMFLNVMNSEKRDLAKELLAFTRKSDSGFFSYTWTKPGYPGDDHVKLDYVKQLKSMDWVIGGGNYLDDMEETTRQEILAWISGMRYSGNQYLFVIRYDGLILSHPMAQFNQKNLFKENHENAYSDIRRLIQVSKKEEGGFVSYDWLKPGTGSVVSKMTYGASVKDWEWVIGTGAYLDDLEQMIDKETDLFNQELKRQILLLSLAFMVCLIFSVIAGFFMTRRLHRGVTVFTDFLTKAADGDIKIDPDRLYFLEFKILGSLANEMVEDRMDKEKALTRSITETRQLQRLLQNITDSMPSALITVDRKMRVLQWNTRAEKITGLSSARVYNRLLSEVYLLTPGEQGLIQQALKTGQPCFENRVQKKQAEELTYEDITVYPLVFDTLEGAVIRIDNTTEKVRLEEMMIQSEKMLSVGGLAAGMAHEINNPLAGIMGNLHVLENRLTQALPANIEAADQCGLDLKILMTYLEKRKILSIIQSIRSAGIRAATIVSDMLSFSRQSDSMFTPLNISELMDKTIELAATDYDLKNRFDFRRIQIVRNYDDTLPEVYCEGGKIQQVFLNILTNGAQAMSTMKGEPMPCFSIKIKHQPPDCIVEIKDNGPGMDEKVAKRIFEPFFTTKEVGVGTGLGLSVSYFIIVDHHRGHMDVESKPGKGTNFIIRLPLVQQS